MGVIDKRLPLGTPHLVSHFICSSICEVEENKDKISCWGMHFLILEEVGQNSSRITGAGFIQLKPICVKAT